MHLKVAGVVRDFLLCQFHFLLVKRFFYLVFKDFERLCNDREKISSSFEASLCLWISFDQLMRSK